ncbi:MAG: hypothetical protein GY694_12310, partial [Gammaproteobacteria bacterium]|nr:hypothetical protein [Gammaproteobacteria bacterium]
SDAWYTAGGIGLQDLAPAPFLGVVKLPTAASLIILHGKAVIVRRAGHCSITCLPFLLPVLSSNS